jgi:hypothetical protein
VVTRQPAIAVLVTSDVSAGPEPQGDPHARQLLRWFATLPVEARFEVHDLARRRHARLAGPSFEVLPADALIWQPGDPTVSGC